MDAIRYWFHKCKKIINKVIPRLFLLAFLFLLYAGVTGSGTKWDISFPAVVFDPLYVIASAVCVFLAIRHCQKTKHLLRTGVKTTAEVTELIRSATGMGDTFFPLFEYRDQSDVKRTFPAGWGSSSPAYDIGDKVRIVYNPHNFEAKVCTFWVLYRRIVFLMGLALCLLLFGVASYV